MPTVKPFDIFNFLADLDFQRANRFSITIELNNGKIYPDIPCDMVQVPSRSLNLRESHFSGVHSPLMTPIGFKTNANVFQFLIDSNWYTRRVFEYWISSVYKNCNSSVVKNDNYGPRIALMDEIKGNIKIIALDSKGKSTPPNEIFVDPLSTEPNENITYELRNCYPRAILPTKFDSSDMNLPLRFMVEIACSDYIWRQ